MIKRIALLLALLSPMAAHAEIVTLTIAAFAAFATTTAGIIAITATVFSAGMAIYGAAQARRAERQARDQRNAAMQDRMTTKIAAESPHRRVYGRAKVGADIVAMFSSGDKDQYKHIVCVLAAHECDAVEEVYVNNIAVGLLNASGDATTGRFAPIPGTEVFQESKTGPTFTLSKMPVGAVQVFTMAGIHMTEVAVTAQSGRNITIGSSGTVIVNYQYAVGRKFGEITDETVTVASAPYVRVQIHLGGATDPADAYLMSVVPDKWPSTAVLRGLCYLVVTLDLNNPEFQGGQVPIQALVRGRKLYDPRTGLTVWSQNPPLAVYDYLTSPLCGVAAADLPTAQFITAANVCDETTGGWFNLPRYTINGTVTSAENQASVLESMAQCMAGGIVSTTWDIYAGKYIAPVLALAQSDIVGATSITPGVSDASIYNGVKGQFISPDNSYVMTDFAPFQNPAYLAADGRDLYTDIPFPFTDSLQRVHNLARIFTEDMRNGFTMKAEFSLKAWPLKVGQRVTFTSAFLGQTAKVYRITDKSFAPNSAVELTLKEDDASIWDFADAVTVDSTPNTDLPDPWAIAPLASLTCTSGVATLLTQADGSIVPRILVTFPVATTQSVFTNGEIEIEWRAISTDTWQRASVSGSATQAYLSPITPGYFYAVRARTFNPYLNVRSNWIMVTYQVAVFTATATAYKWAADMPAMPSGADSWTWATSTFAAPPSGWSSTEPAAPTGGDSTLWTADVLVSDVSASGSTPFNWNTAVISARGYAASPTGAGPAGYSNARVFAYQRAASAPTGTPGTVDYDFTTGLITTSTLSNGWLKTIPAADGNPLYVTAASASAAGTTDTINTSEWSSAVVFAYDGGAGTPGLNAATVTIYHRSATATAPTLPSASTTYTFATGVLTGLNNGWTTYIPAASGGPYLFASTATAISASATDAIASSEWAATQVISQDGAAGSNGTSVHVGRIYLQNATLPSTPTGGTFNFSTAALTPPSTWSATQPASSTTPTWVAQYTFSTSTPGATVTAATWSTPVAVAQNGAAGASGTQAAIAYLYKWATSAPSAPTGTSTLTWATGANATYTAGDGWSVTVPSNPGTPGSALYVVAVAVTAAAGATSTSVSYSGAAVQAWSLNGANGSNGVQSGAAIVYQWAATIPSGPAGAATYTWSTGAFGSAPSGWALTPGTSPSPGYTLWQARVGVTDSAANTTTAFNWTSAAITAVGYAGNNGGAGAEGASYVTAYCASATASTTTAPSGTTGRTSLPATNSGGITGTYSATVPSLTSGQYLYQTDGIYNPATNQVTWSIPYWSSLKVGSLSAIVVNTGDLNISGTISSANGNFSVDSSGNAIAKALTIKNGAATVLDTGGLKAGYEAPDTKNSDQTLAGIGFTGDVNANFVPPSKGSAINEDPAIEKPSAWSMSGSTAISSGASGTGVAGDRYFRSQAWALNSKVESAKYAIDPNKTYSLTANVFQDGFNDRAMFIFIQFFDGSGGYLGNAGWGGWTSGYVYAGVPPSGWSRQGAQFGAGVSGRSVPSNARTCTVGVWFNFDGSGSTTTAVQGAQDLRLELVVGAALLDGATNNTLAAVNDATLGLSSRLRANAANVLAGGAGLTAGTLTYDTSGNRTGGFGMAFNQRGIVGYNSSGVATITMDVSTGAVAVAGDISGSTGTFGAVTVGTSLNCGQSAYNTGNGFWLGLVSGTAKFSVGNSAGSNIRWDGSTLTVSGQIIGNGNLTTGAAHTADVFSSSFTTTVPFVMPRTGTVIIKARVNPAAGDKAGFKLYNEGTVGSPGTVAATSEHYEAGLGTTAVDVWISQPLTAGNYWLGPSNASYAVLSAFVIKVLA